jgi:hypothetical protein
MHPRIKHIEARPGFKLFVEFVDGVCGELEMANELTGVFAPLRDPSLFAQVRVDAFGAPTWPNGADIAPDAAYDEIAGTKTNFV